MSRRNKYLEGPTIHHYKFRRKPNRSVGGDVGIYIFLALCSLIMVFPLVFAIATSLKPLDELLKNPPTIFPRNPTFDNYSDLFVTLSQSQWVPFTRYVFNTVFITVVGTLGHVIFASMAAYVLAKYNFPGGSLFFRVAVVALMFSGYVTGIPNYLIMCRLHMVDTYWALILPAIGASMGLFLMKQFMEGFPMSLIEAAKIDGANEMLIFWKLVMPNVRPAWLTISIFSIQGLWNNAQTQYIFTEGKKMLRYALDQIQAGGIARTGQASAVIVFTMSVPIIFFIFSQSQIMETMATSGLKD
ncbi:MAG: carbohydrate ABC transporter permease [Treponema sp.]|nr:carbohydrate ABC transporter permease [Treponema sp.]